VANVFDTQLPAGSGGGCSPIEERVFSGSQPIAAAWAPDGTLVAQMRSPPGLQTDQGRFIAFPVEPRNDLGFTLFHQQAGPPITCAGCHPEGREDGRTWQFLPDGARRTQSLSVGLSRTAPFHWDGKFNDMTSLVGEVLVHRMGGANPSGDQVGALIHWLDALALPRPSAVADPAAVARGQSLFQSTEVGCATCHSGPQLTNNTTVDVGTGMLAQVPSLVGVSARAPYMHNGCAPTLTDRFGSCGGGDQHGHTSQLSTSQIADLVAYLQTL
jgi:cytochrome c peroxidase